MFNVPWTVMSPCRHYECINHSPCKIKRNHIIATCRSWSAGFIWSLLIRICTVSHSDSLYIFKKLLNPSDLKINEKWWRHITPEAGQWVYVSWLKFTLFGVRSHKNLFKTLKWYISSRNKQPMSWKKSCYSFLYQRSQSGCAGLFAQADKGLSSCWES